MYGYEDTSLIIILMPNIETRRSTVQVHRAHRGPLGGYSLGLGVWGIGFGCIANTQLSHLAFLRPLIPSPKG